jgi:hypothetical protein
LAIIFPIEIFHIYHLEKVLAPLVVIIGPPASSLDGFLASGRMRDLKLSSWHFKEDFRVTTSSTLRSPRKKPTLDHLESRAAERRRQEALAIGYIASYFSAFKVPADVDLKSRRYIDICLDSDICSAVDAAYKSMKSCGRMQGACGDGTIGEDVRLVLRLLKGIRASCVPQELSAGILLMHLEILEKIPF